MTWLLFAASLAFSAAVLASREKTREQLAVLLLGPAVLSFIALVQVYAQATYAMWVEEDRWIEWGTAAVFRVATIGFIRRAKATEGVARVVFAGLGLVCFLAAGEEISWAQRLFFVQPPDVLLQENFQQELNLHNLFSHREVAGF